MSQKVLLPSVHTMACLWVLLLMAAGPKSAGATEPSNQEVQAPPASQTADAQAVPPPSDYDKAQAGSNEPASSKDATVGHEERSMVAQLGQAIVALLMVITLIYVLGKLAGAKLAGLKIASGSGQILRLVDKLQLDAKNTLYMVEVGSQKQLLVGTGDKGVALIYEPQAPIEGKPQETPGGAIFRALMKSKDRQDAPKSDANEQKPNDGELA